jgi:hypothetical protein
MKKFIFKFSLSLFFTLAISFLYLIVGQMGSDTGLYILILSLFSPLFFILVHGILQIIEINSNTFLWIYWIVSLLLATWSNIYYYKMIKFVLNKYKKKL